MKYLLVVACIIQFGCTHLSNRHPLTQQIEYLRKHYQVPGASIAIIDNGKVTKTISLGYANIAKHIPVKPNTLFQACSMTKTLTSTLVLMEFEGRRLSIDRPVNHFLLRWKIPPHASNGEVTVRMLLDHTGAISDPYPDGGTELAPKKATLVEQFNGQWPALNPPLQVEKEPGVQYQYCNGCYAILQMLIEDLTGKDYQELIKTKLLDPIGMNHSRFDDTLLDKQPDFVALNYNDDHQVYPPTRKMPILATGSLWSTPTDMAKFIIEIQNALMSESKIISHRVARALMEPSSTSTRTLGFFLGDELGNQNPTGSFFFHGGQNIGYLSLMIGHRLKKLGAVVMINISSPWNAKSFPHFEFIRRTMSIVAKTE